LSLALILTGFKNSGSALTNKIASALKSCRLNRYNGHRYKLFFSIRTIILAHRKGLSLEFIKRAALNINLIIR
jgi:hypothetical protein